jgi:hypothetical protein
MTKLVATDEARELAKELRHAAVVAVQHHRYRSEFKAFDSWCSLPDGWEAVSFVSVSGKVVATAPASAP